MGFHRISIDFKGLQGTSRDYKGFNIFQGISRDCKGLQGIARDLMGYHWISNDFKVHSSILSISDISGI